MDFLFYLGSVIRVHLVTTLLDRSGVQVKVDLVLIILWIQSLHGGLVPREYVLILHKQLHYCCPFVKGYIVGDFECVCVFVGPKIDRFECGLFDPLGDIESSFERVMSVA